MVKVTLGIPHVLSVEWDATNSLRHLGDLSKPVVIVKRDAQGLAFDTGLVEQSGAPLTVWSLHGENHQLWFLDRRDRGAMSIRSAKTGLVISGSTMMSNGDHIKMTEWMSKPWQKWYFYPVAEARAFAIVSATTAHGRKAMDVWEGAEPGSPVQVWDWLDGPSQKFVVLRPQQE